MTTQVWISTAKEPDGSGLAPDWLHAGELNQGREVELWSAVQRYLGLRAGRSGRSVDFYADLYPDSPGYGVLFPATAGSPDHSHVNVAAPTRFWLALLWTGPPARTLIAVEQASLAHLVRRPPESHPGLLTPVVPVGMQLGAADGVFFREP